MVVLNAPVGMVLSSLQEKIDESIVEHSYNHGINSVITAHATAVYVGVVLNQHGENVMKKPKICAHCDARFKNRENMRNHLIFFHNLNLSRIAEVLLTKRLHQLRPKPHKEHKALRRIRMAMCQVRRKKEREL